MNYHREVDRGFEVPISLVVNKKGMRIRVKMLNSN